MSPTKVTFYEPILDRFLNHPNGQVGRYLATRGRRIVRAAKRQVGVDTGQLRASIHMRHLRDSRGQYLKIGSSAKHALMHHEGTRPHVIPVGRDHVRRFATRGTMVYLDVVRHPGTKANKYLSDQLDKASMLD